MSETTKGKPTPGPWVANWSIRQDVGQEMGWAVFGRGDDVPVVAEISDYNENRSADAALISAAPDLLAALSDLAAYVDGYEYAASWAGRPHQIMDNARAAIAKAKGEA